MRVAAFWTWVLLGCFMGMGCAQAPLSMLPPQGPGAAGIADLWWVLFWATGIPAVAVILFTLFLFLRRRRPDPDRLVVGDDAFIIGGGILLPAAVIAILLTTSVRTGGEVAHPSREPALTIDVIGHQFWWEVRYPAHQITTANEIHVPAGEPVRLRLASADVIHSFWVPRLHGKIDTVPGKVNTFWIEADRPGAYRGQCAEFCGVQHALMGFWVVASPRASFEAWLADHRRPAAEPATEAARRGRAVFEDAGCSVCHVVQGHTDPTAGQTAGPDFTHLARRRTLGAARLPNDREALAGWIQDPHAFKPGVRMPATALAPGDLHDLLDYLEGLR
jgi:cytochrome c oxidase subunit II